jgi:hypothetical protein
MHNLDTESSRAAEAAARAKWDRLRAAHPDVETLSATCGVGWLPLVAAFLDEAKAKLPEGARLTMLRAREKRGLLSLAYRVAPLTRETSVYDGLMAAAARIEMASRQVCETCGEPGRLRRLDDGRPATRCGKHATPPSAMSVSEREPGEGDF